MTEDEMVGWHHRLNRQESEKAVGVGDGQGNLVCCSPWGCIESDMTEPLNCTELRFFFFTIFKFFLSSSIFKKSK